MPKGFLIPSNSNLPYLSEYLGCWCMLPHVLEQAFDHVSRIDLVAHVRQQQQSRDPMDDNKPRQSYDYEVTDSGIAILNVMGTLMKQESSLGSSTSTTMLRKTIRNANRDPDVKAIMLRIDSPGGTTAGTEELAVDVFDSKKPIGAFIDGTGASAAYWIASQADFISALSTAIVGSIGTYMAVRDTSAAAAASGVKVHLVRSAEVKGAGTPGTEVTSKQLAEWQRMIDESQSVFTAGVARGRGISMDDATALADARVHVGKAAQAVGLVDYVEGFEAAMKRLESSLSPAAPIQPPAVPRRKSADAAPQIKSEELGGTSAEPTTTSALDAPAESAQQPSAAESSAMTTGVEPMSTAPTTAAPTQLASAPQQQQAAPAAPSANEPKPATIGELKAAFPNNPAFGMDCAEKAMTLLEAKAAYADVLAKENDELRKKAAAPQQQAAPAAKPGVKPIETKQTGTTSGHEIGEAYGSGEAADTFKSMVEDTLAKHPKMTRMDAVASVAKKNPDLHQQYVDANQQKQRN